MSKVFEENNKSALDYILKECDNDYPDEDFVIELIDKLTDEELKKRNFRLYCINRVITYNHIKIAKKLIVERKIKLDYEYKHFNYAILNNYYEMAKLILDNIKVCVNWINFGDRTALMGVNDVRCAKLLLDHPKIHVNVQTEKNKSTALMLQKDPLIIEMLLTSQKINVNMQNRKGNTALMIHGNVDIVKMLLTSQNVNVNIKNKKGDCALTMHANNKKILKMLLNRNDININAKNRSGKTLFMILANKRGYFLDILEILLQDPKLKLDIEDNYGNNVMYYADSYTKKLLQDNKIDL